VLSPNPPWIFEACETDIINLLPLGGKKWGWQTGSIVSDELETNDTKEIGVDCVNLSNRFLLDDFDQNVQNMPTRSVPDEKMRPLLILNGYEEFLPRPRSYWPMLNAREKESKDTCPRNPQSFIRSMVCRNGRKREEWAVVTSCRTTVVYTLSQIEYERAFPGGESRSTSGRSN
jgi:hypothetical protein